jgi:AraC family chitin signaling transcriptional activator
MRNVIIILFFLFIQNVGISQNLRINTYQEEQSLPSNLTKSIIEDSKGFIWIGSDQGLWRFDGKHFLVFNNHPIPNIKSFFIRKNGQLLVIHDGGITEIVNKTDTVLFNPILIASPGNNATISYPKSIYEDSNNVLWISEPGAIVSYKDQKIKRYPFEAKNATSSFLRSFIIIEDKKNTLFVASQQGYLFYLDTKADRFREIELPHQGNDFINALLRMKNGKIWIGGSNGINEITLNEKHEVIALNTINSELKNISCLSSDADGEIYAGTWNSGAYTIQEDSGLYKIYKIEDLHFKTINTIYFNSKRQFLISSDEGIAILHKINFSKVNLPSPRSFIQSLILGKDEKAYTTDGSKLYALKRKKDGFEIEVLMQAQKEDYLSIAQVDSFFWVGTNSGMLHQVKNKKVTKKINIGKTFGGTSLFYLFADAKKNIWVCHDLNNVIQVSPDFTVKSYSKGQGILSNILVIKADHKGTIYCGGTGKKTYLYRFNKINDVFENISLDLKKSSDDNFAVNDLCSDDSGNLWLATNQGLYLYDGKSMKRFSLINFWDNFEIAQINSVSMALDSGVWLGTNVGLFKYYNPAKYVLYDKLSGLPSKTIIFRNIIQDKQWGLMAATTNGLGYSDLLFSAETTPKPLFLSLKLNGKKVNYKEDSTYHFKDYSFFEAEMATLSYPNDKVSYTYRILGKDKQWTIPSITSVINIPQLRSGLYTLEIRALNQGGYYWSAPVRFHFTIGKSIFQTWWAICIYILLFATIIYLVVRLYTAHLIREKINLERVVKERTAEISGQKEEIFEQKEKMEVQKNILEEKSNKLALAYRDIQDSIDYAKTIQEAMLQNISAVEGYVEDLFIFLKPRDVVSGDFYWFAKKENKLIISAVDCTGHGVPGALMSMVGNAVLNQIVNEKGILESDQILKRLHMGIRSALKQDETSSRDGMDLALCVIDKKQNTLQFSGAHNPIYYIQNKEMKIIKGDNLSIGGGNKSIQSFTKHTIDITVPTIFYLFSDGFQDQVGGEEKIKFMRQKFQDMLFKIHEEPMEKQKEIIENTLHLWKGNREQTDDILIIGVKV